MSNTYVPLHLHSHYSLLDSINKPEHIVKRLTELNIDTCALTDHGNICGAIAFLKAMNGAKKKPIIGCELYISEFDANIKNENNRHHNHLLVLAKNDLGWKTLVRLTSLANHPDNFYYKPRLSLEQLKEFANGSLVAFAGHFGSVVANAILDKDGNVLPDGLNQGLIITNQLKNMFGDDFYLESQLIDSKHKLLVEIIREIAKKTNTKVIAVGDAHYCYPEQASDHAVALATKLNKTIYEATNPEFGMSNFFLCKQYYIHSYEEMLQLGNTVDELQNTIEVANKCEEYKSILGPLILPPFKTPNGQTTDEYLLELCQAGWEKKIVNKGLDLKIYQERLDEELNVLQGAKLTSYFLIIQDLLDYVRKQGWLPGPGRGSSSGCLVSHLLNITQVDPIKYDLLFSRFYNEGRNTAERISLPDIDIDIPAYKREYIIQYIKDKYGIDKVGQMVTFQTMKGRGALKAVLRAHNAVTASEMNLITKHFPEESKIIDELQIMKKDKGESSIIRWTLENDDKGLLKEWCYIDEKGELRGPLAKYFEQAIRLEGTKNNQSKHAAGILIASEPLASICPMIYDSKTKSVIAGLEMGDAEAIGMTKYDLLGLTLLDKLMGISDILKYGDTIS